MIFSYNWLKTYFEQDIPAPEDLGLGIIFHAFELEGTDPILSTDGQGEKVSDTILDIKILPDREHDCLSHFGLAGEVSAIFALPKKEISKDYGELKKDFGNRKLSRELKVAIDSPDLCRRYIGRMIENVNIAESPAWLKTRLESVGQRSISNIVDATNYVMLDVGQPMHAFDADKVVGNIVVRRAQEGEQMTTLDGKELCLTTNDLVIADDLGLLALAGIKGGNRAEVDANTKNIILESANFHPVSTRRTSAAVGIRTDASKRYENELHPEVAAVAMDNLSSLIYSVAGGDSLLVGDKVDVYPNPTTKRVIEIVPAEINKILGIVVPEEKMLAILQSLDIKVSQGGATWALEIPFRRVDLEVKENIVEEVGRIYGYDKIPALLLDSNFKREGEKIGEKRYNVANKIREILIKQGFSEVYGYAFTSKGDVEIANPLASDKAFLRDNLSEWLSEKLAFNLQYVLFDNEPVKIFEIGKVFKIVGENIIESTSVVIGTASKAKKFNADDVINQDVKELSDVFGLNDKDGCVLKSTNIQDIKGAVLELSFDKIAAEAKDFELADLEQFVSEKLYKKTSLFPRIIRDIALWVPEGVTEDEVVEVIKNSAGELLVEGPVLFDRFPKEGRVSLAFRQVFQSYEKTLSDDEVNEVMAKVTQALVAKGWETR